MIRDKRSNRKEFATAKRMKLMRDDNIDTRRTGFLPTLSDYRPNNGEKTNCINEKEPINIPRAKAPASVVSG